MAEVGEKEDRMTSRARRGEEGDEREGRRREGGEETRGEDERE